MKGSIDKIINFNRTISIKDFITYIEETFSIFIKYLSLDGFLCFNLDNDEYFFCIFYFKKQNNNNNRILNCMDIYENNEKTQNLLNTKIEILTYKYFSCQCFD